MKAAKQRDFRRIPVRFWFLFGGKTLRITLIPGEIQAFHDHHPTDEGWQSDDALFRVVDRQLVQQWRSDGRDCDGRLTNYGELVCPVHRRQRFRANRWGLKKVPRHRFPVWTSVSEERRDAFAIAMGY